MGWSSVPEFRRVLPLVGRRLYYPSMKSPWYRHFLYRKQVLKTTWTLRLLIVLALAALVLLPRAYWAEKIGQSLVCEEQVAQSDALLLENFDISYLIFERATALQKSGIAPRAFVPTTAAGADHPNEVSRQLVDVMARAARLEKFEYIPIREKEPISLNAGEQIRDFLTREHIRSVLVITPGFRSRRSEIVYKAVLGPGGIRVGCLPVFGSVTTANWTSTWHGIQNVVEQFGKLQYYRFSVLR
jgi:hypothetical protein